MPKIRKHELLMQHHYGFHLGRTESKLRRCGLKGSEAWASPARHPMKTVRGTHLGSTKTKGDMRAQWRQAGVRESGYSCKNPVGPT